MDKTAHDVAVRLLDDAARTGVPIDALPPQSKPASVAEALHIQDALVRRSGKTVAGWKVSTDTTGAVMYGAIYAEDCTPSPTVIDSKRYPLLGLEAEIAYRFTSDLPARGAPYFRGDLERILAPFAVFEIVHSRYASYQQTPVLDRLADRMSNGGIVAGPDLPSHSAPDLLTLTVDGRTVHHGPGEHSRGDPLLPAMDFVRAVQHLRSFQAGQFITTGTLTGLRFLHAGQSAFAAYNGDVQITLTCK